MSWDMGSWARAQRAGSTAAKCILLLLADEADSRGYCQPLQQDLAAAAECSLDTVSRHVRRLEQAGLVLLRRTRRADGSWARWEYLLAAPGCPDSFAGIASPPRKLQGGSVTDVEVPSSHPESAVPPVDPAPVPSGAHVATQTPARPVVPASSRAGTHAGSPAAAIQGAGCGVDDVPDRTVPSGGRASAQASATPHPAGPQSAGSKPSSGGGGGSPPSKPPPTATPHAAAWDDDTRPLLDAIRQQLTDGDRLRLDDDPSRDAVERPDGRLTMAEHAARLIVSGGWDPDTLAARIIAVGPLATSHSIAAVIAARLNVQPDTPPAEARQPNRPVPDCLQCDGTGWVADTGAGADVAACTCRTEEHTDA